MANSARFLWLGTKEKELRVFRNYSGSRNWLTCASRLPGYDWKGDTLLLLALSLDGSRAACQTRCREQAVDTVEYFWAAPMFFLLPTTHGPATIWGWRGNSQASPSQKDVMALQGSCRQSCAGRQGSPGWLSLVRLEVTGCELEILFCHLWTVFYSFFNCSAQAEDGAGRSSAEILIGRNYRCSCCFLSVSGHHTTRYA